MNNNFKYVCKNGHTTDMDIPEGSTFMNSMDCPECNEVARINHGLPDTYVHGPNDLVYNQGLRDNVFLHGRIQVNESNVDMGVMSMHHNGEGNQDVYINGKKIKVKKVEFGNHIDPFEADGNAYARSSNGPKSWNFEVPVTFGMDFGISMEEFLRSGKPSTNANDEFTPYEEVKPKELPPAQ